MSKKEGDERRPRARSHEESQEPPPHQAHRHQRGGPQAPQGRPERRETQTREIWEDRGLVFLNRTGGFLSPYPLTDGPLKRPLERAGLPSIRFHDLRHTWCATILFSRGVHAKLVQELLGHATISITLDIYSHALPGMDDGLAAAMGDALEYGRAPRWCQAWCQKAPAVSGAFPFSRALQGFRSEPPRTRTWNLEIKSLLLCQLS